MKNPMHKLRRFFVRSRTYNAAAAARAAQTPHEEDDGGNRLSGAFIIVLVLHVIAVVGVFAFARIKESRSSSAPQNNSTQTAATKGAPAKPAAAKTAVATATIAAANPQPAAQLPKIGTPAAHTTHVVREGETLTKIATQYSVGVSDFVSLNKLKSQDDIHKGQALAIPSTKQPQRSPAPAEIKPAQTAVQKTTPAPADHKPPKTYTVRKGDTPVKIAREHGCTYEELIKVNSIKDPKKIQPGQTLKIPVKNG